MGWSAQFFTTIIIEGNTPQTGIFIYNGTPGLGTLIGAWAAQAGTDAFGNTYVAGINVNQGNITGVSITQSTATVLNILASVFANGTINASTFNQGQINETTIIFDSGGGMLFGYTSSTTTVTNSVQGDYTWTSPITGTASIFCTGAGPGGDGGNTSEGGNGGGAGECAGEPNYAVVNGNVYDYTVGAAGANSSTGNGHGGDGGDTLFDQSGPGIIGNGGNGDGTPGTGSTNSVHFDGGTGGGQSGNTGGASGANSANKTAKGNNGIASVGSAGAAQPASQAGSGRGGAGGAAGANGSNGASPGGGGGGAGQGTSSGGTLTKTYEALYTASYLGPDASFSPNSLRSTTTLYQGGETSGGGAANGNQRCVMVFDSNQIASDFAGYTPSSLVLKLVNQHSWFNSGMTVEFDVGASPHKYPTSGGVPATWLGNQNFLATGTIAEGATHSYSLGAACAGFFINNQTNFLGLGAFVAANHPYDLTYYGFFTGGHGTALEITISGTKSVAGSNNSGTGADGNVTIIYASSSVLEMALAPSAGTDPSSNAYAAGYTGPVSNFQPGSSPTVIETYHALPLINSWVESSDNLAHYYMDAMGFVHINAVIVSGTAVTVTSAIPAAYRPASKTFYGACVGTGTITTGIFAQMTTAGVLSLNTITNVGDVVINFTYPSALVGGV